MKIFPNAEFAKNAYFKSFEEYQKLYDYSMENYEDFWEALFFVGIFLKH